jgi:hypothetical protein
VSDLQSIAERVRMAYESRELSLLGEVLADDVRWGGGDEDAEYTCHTRTDVLNTYGALVASGIEAEVTEVTVRDARVIVGLEVIPPEGERHPLFQAFSVRDGKVVDIRGYPTRAEALAGEYV